MENCEDLKAAKFFSYFNPIFQKKKKKKLSWASHEYFELIFWSNTSRVSQVIYQFIM